MRPSRVGRAARLLPVVLVVGVSLAAEDGLGAPVADTLPFHLLYGHPNRPAGNGPAAYLWSQGGRLHLRFAASQRDYRLEGELRTNNGGTFRDVRPLSEELRIDQPRPSKIEFTARTERRETGLDVTLAGDFTQVTIDLLIDGERRPTTLHIGGRRIPPRGLPARLTAKGAEAGWIERFGF